MEGQPAEGKHKHQAKHGFGHFPSLGGVGGSKRQSDLGKMLTGSQCPLIPDRIVHIVYANSMAFVKFQNPQLDIEK